MHQPITIFDHALLRQRRARVREEAGFLQREVAGRLAERLDVVRRELPVVHCPAILAQELKGRAGTEEVVSGDMLEWEGERLPFAPGSLDAFVSCLELHWVNDLPGVLVQARRALKPDGLFLAALAGGETLKELRAALMEAELLVTGGASPRVSPFADVRDMGGLLQRAGFALPVADVDRIVVDYPDMFKLMHDLRGMGAANAVLARIRKPTRRAVFFEAARIYKEKFGNAEGLIPATFDILYCTAWSPHESQQKPLQPGSAKARLAEALEAEEVSAGERAG